MVPTPPEQLAVIVDVPPGVGAEGLALSVQASAWHTSVKLGALPVTEKPEQLLSVNVIVAADAGVATENTAAVARLAQSARNNDCVM